MNRKKLTAEQKIAKKEYDRKRNEKIGKESLSEKGKAYYAENSELIKFKSNNYYQNNKEKVSALKKEYNKSLSGKLSAIKSSAKLRNIEFLISQQEYEKYFYNKICFYCGELNTTGIDRVDPLGNYALNNCLPCCSDCNYMKRDFTFDKFIVKIKNIYNNLS